MGKITDGVGSGNIGRSDENIQTGIPEGIQKANRTQEKKGRPKEGDLNCGFSDVSSSVLYNPFVT